MLNRRYFAQLDWVSVMIAFSLSCIGLLFIYSASRDFSETTFLWRQLIWFACGLILFLMVLQIDYHTLTHYVHFLYGAALLGLLAVLVFGTEVRGHRSWLHVGSIVLQPSEFVKVITIVALARFFSRSNRDYLGW